MKVLRQSLLKELKNEWHPSIPSKDVIVNQIIDGKGRIGGNERLASMRVSVRGKLPSTTESFFVRSNLFIRGVCRRVCKRLRGLC